MYVSPFYRPELKKSDFWKMSSLNSIMSLVAKASGIQTFLGYSNGGEDTRDVVALAGRISNGRTLRGYTSLPLDDGKCPCHGVNSI